MPVTAEQLQQLEAAYFDWHMDRSKVHQQSIQARPLYNALYQGKMSYPGTKEYVSLKVSGDFTTTIQGFEYDDTVTYADPHNIRKASFTPKSIHAGIQTTYQELAESGVSFSDTSNGTGPTTHTNAEKVALVNILDNKLFDMSEGMARDMNLMFWRDGTADPKLAAGIQSFILDDPTTATVVGGIDQSANTWWRNRASLSISGAGTSSLGLITELQKEFRQLRRYGRPKHRFFCGSDFMDAFEAELREKGVFTQTGWADKGIDASIADPSFSNVRLEYDPSLDDEGKAGYGYVLDMNAIKMVCMEGEDMKRHTPARPADKYVMYRAVTWRGTLACRMRNTSGVYSV